MSDKVQSEIGKVILDSIIGFERLQYSSTYDKSDNPNSIYFLYSSTLKLINRVLVADIRDARIFRLKYHHILSNESVDEYLFHCLSKILSDLLEIENNYQRFIQPVADLHMKLMSILTTIQLQLEKIVLANDRVKHDIRKRLDKCDSNIDAARSENVDKTKLFIPIYFLPSCCPSKRLKRNQSLTCQAIDNYYSTNNSLDKEVLDMLLDFDNAFAEFELDFVCQVNKTSIFTTHRAELTMNVAVMFSEAVQWAHSIDLLQYSSIADCDIEIMVGIPRLAVLYGCKIINSGPLSEWALNCRNDFQAEERLAPVFHEHRQELGRLRRQLNVLNTNELYYLSQLLMDNNDLPLITLDNNYTGNMSSSLKEVSKHYQISGDMHALFKLVSSVADQMQSKHASDYRFFMETLFKLFKDESDLKMLSSSSYNSKSLSHSDLFSSKYKNVYSCVTNIEQAVEALNFSVTGQLSVDNLLDLSFLSQWDTKMGQSGNQVSDQFSSEGAPLIRRSSSQSTDLNMLSRPEWRPDSFFPRCCHCNRAFNVFRRRHHCRRCGYLFCNSCWGTKMALPSLGIQNKVSVCIECEEFLNGKDLQTPTTTTAQSAS